MKCMRWLLLVAAALASVQALEDVMASHSLMELKQILLASSQLQNGRRLLSIDLFEDHAARYLTTTEDTSKEVVPLYKLYKELYPTQVAAWATTESLQLTYFEKNVFPKIKNKADKLLKTSRLGANGLKNGDESDGQMNKGDGLTPSGNSNSQISNSKTPYSGVSPNRGTSANGGTTLSGGTLTSDGMSANDRASGDTSGRGSMFMNGDRISTNGGGTPAEGGGTSVKGGGTSVKDGGTSAEGGGTSVKGGGTSVKGGGPSAEGGGASGKGGGTLAEGGGTSAEGGGSSAKNGGTSVKGGGMPAGGGGTSAQGGGTSAQGGGTPAEGGGISTSRRSITVSGTLAATSTSTPTRSASGTSFWSATYNSKLSTIVGSLSSQVGTIQTVVQSSSGSSSSSSLAVNRYTAPTTIQGYTSPSRRYLTDGTSHSSNIDLLFCDVAGNAIWKWSAQDVPDATVTNTSSSTTEIDVDVNGVCSATTTLTVSAFQSGCSYQNHPEGCDNVYYKGCSGITVSPTSDRIVIARNAGRTLGVLNYKSVGNSCQGQIVDAITMYRGKKFNSPSYAEYASNGILYFTDSPFGLATSDADFDGDTLDKSPLREIPFNGVYMLRNGTNQSVELVDCDMTRPNKIAFSPAQDIMYITNSQKNNSYVKSYNMADDGTVSKSSIFFNFTAHPELETEAGYATGIKVDDNGFVYVVCYKGVYVFSPEAELASAIMSSEELDSVSMALGRLFISGSFGLVAQTIGVPSQTLPRAAVTCSA
ncbi:unnamed protein product [Peronospora farinosa]|uniref:SMP-30/Gluconolactonase/LRE-like region domain-containing protein n=1 Tax=Peronospora farinosa TaxID=134698 RepID=A0ABN8C1T3_9STRA|nr:unnamed protein product [Peronospora farinosa]